ncbi:hypothetical protein EWM64_g10280 [Hericium alpestre]|uniref:Uncharacterized protein n=1 Tax=Hericium alpestre TaxID=135208 RepID=A0A4Y9ZGL0_9AGAM|nr:hypothetical protein EWM64_g10280 [Hericium alpestre]
MIATASGSTDVISNPVIMSSSGSVCGSAPGSHSDSVPGPGPGSVSGTAILGSVSHSVVDLVIDSLSGSVIDSLSCSVVKSVSGSVIVQPLSGSAADSLSGSVAASLSGSVAASLSGSVAASVTAAAISGSVADSLSGSPSVPLSSLPSEPGVPSTLQSAQLANLSSCSRLPDDISAGLDLEQCPTAAQDDQNIHPSEVVDKGKGKEVTVPAHVTARIVPKVKNPFARNLFGRDYIIKNPNTTTQQFTQIWDNLDVATKQEYEQKAVKLCSNKAATAAAVNNATAM